MSDLSDSPAANHSQLRPDPSRIIVPRAHGQILIEPPMSDLLASPPVFPDAPEAPILGIPRWVIAETARGELLEAINQHAKIIGAPQFPRSIEETPWIITGHQLEFYHAGVWAKAVAASHIAKQKNGLAIDLLVDHDVIDELGFDVPVLSAADNRWSRNAVTWDESAGLTADALRSPTIEQFDHWDSELGDLPATHVDALAHVLTDLRPRGEGGDEPYPIWMSRARQRLETVLGVSIAHVPTSQLCSGTTWFLFVLGWIRNARAWSEIYNKQLAAYRNKAGIKSPMHPMPDLSRRPIQSQPAKHTGLTEDCFEIELPFWIYSPGQTRSRLLLRITPSTTHILFNDQLIDLPGIENESAWESVQALKRICRSWNVILRPRALTLTMYVRLFLADLFIHGIGGALYDQITDGILHEIFGIATPYACVSAAWLLPLARSATDETTVSDLLHERHHLFHNPQRGIDPFTSLRTEIAELIRDRRELIEQLNASVKHDRQAGRVARAQMFTRLHAVNADLHLKVPKVLARLDADLSAARDQATQDKILLWREYYFALHTTQSLTRLIEQIQI